MRTGSILVMLLSGGLLALTVVQPAAAGGWRYVQAGGHAQDRRVPEAPRAQPQYRQPPGYGQRGPAPQNPQNYGRPAQMPAPQPAYAPQYGPPRSDSPGQAANQAQRLYGGGRVLSVDPNRGPNGDYRVKLLKDGEVRVVTVPGG